MNFIQHLSTPSRLLLGWQHRAAGRIFTVGKLENRQDNIIFKYLVGSDDFLTASDQGFSGYPAFPLHRPEVNTGVLDVFMRRLPPRNRRDFPEYLKQLRISADMSPSDFALLGYSGARLLSDGFSLIWPLDDIRAPAEVLLEVAGFRYQQVQLSELRIDMPAMFIRELDNEDDPNAIRIEVSGRRIGYVKRAQCAAISSWLDSYNIQASIERFNGTNDRPIIYLFCRISEREHP